MMSFNHVKFAGALLVLAASLAALVFARPAEAAFPGENGRISYHTRGDVWTISPNGAGVTRLTNDYNAEGNPAYSPDGSRVAYEFLRGIWVMNADGSGKHPLTDGAAIDEDPTWSPDGTRIAFSRSGDIWVMNADGSGLANLTQTSQNAERDPAWSPAGGKISYTRIGCDVPRGGGSCVYVMDEDGSNQTNLTPETTIPGCENAPSYGHYGTGREPSFSPDGSRITFSGSLICPNTIGRDVWVMNADGSAKVNLTNDQGTADTRPSFSPDGTKIIFESDRDTDWPELYVMNAANGSGITRLTSTGTSTGDVDWQPVPVCDVSGTAAGETLAGTPGADVICGLGGNDRIDGGGGDDIVLGGEGNDALIGTEGRDTLNGGPGTDTASFAASETPVEASLTSGFARRMGLDPLEGVALVAVEGLTGSPLADTLSGSAGANVLVGGKGADTLLGLGGGDRLDSRDGAKNDTVNGGPGNDRCATDAREVAIRSCE